MGRANGGVAVEPAVQIRLVRENLGLAIALLAAAQRGVISAGFVPNSSEVESSTGERVRVLAALEVHDTRDLVRCVNNQIRGAFAISAVQANRALESVFGNSPISDPDSEVREARCILYLLSQTVSNDLMVPLWVCPPEYRRTFEVPSASFVLDASALNGKKVYWDDFGGLSRYLDLLEFCGNQIASPSTPPKPFKPSSRDGALMPDLLPTPTDGSVAEGVPQDSVPQFVEARCQVGERELVLAKDLFDAYLRWCASEGDQPLGQRSFGMKLSTLGFERRRRGKGKHWWMGISLAESRAAASGVAD